MSRIHFGLPAVICVVLFANPARVAAQQAPPKGAAASPQSIADADAARKDEILGSDCWRRAMFELNEWFRVQTIYTPAEVAKLKADFAARVNNMSAAELQFVLADLDAKFRILETPQAQDVRAWLGNYLAILSTQGREQLLRTIPDFQTMTAAQLQQTINQLAQRRDSRARQQGQVQQLRSAATNPWVTERPAVSRPAQRSAYHSPYRPQPRERPFENVQVGPRRTMGVGPNGQLWVNMNF